MGFKFLQFELDSKVVLTWLTNNNMNYLINIMPFICDCRNLIDQGWEVYVQHVYREANGYADDLAKRGTRQRNLVSVYSDCPNFVDVLYVRDLTGLRETRLCVPGASVGVVWTQFYINKTSRFPLKKKKNPILFLSILSIFINLFLSILSQWVNSFYFIPIK